MAEFPAVSTAVQETVVVPVGNSVTEPGEQVTRGRGSMLSVALATYDTTAPAGLVAGTEMAAGTVSVGRVVSAVVDTTARDADDGR